jgi:general secretion pathway protein C
MNQNFNKKFRFFMLFIALPLVLAKLIWSGALIFLDKSNSKILRGENYNYHYSLSLADKFIGEHKVLPKKRVDKDDGEKLDNIKLKGTYLGGDASFIIIEDGTSESKFIYIGDDFRGYNLTKVGESKVVFEKGGKNYYVLLNDKDNRDTKSKASSISDNMPPPPDEIESTPPTTPATIERSELNSYIKNPDKIWKNIRIQEQRSNGQISGFRVNYVKKGSFFERGGLRSGDIIKGIDGNEIKSLADVMKYYTNIDSLDSLSLTVLRGGSEIELDFSVN